MLEGFHKSQCQKSIDGNQMEEHLVVAVAVVVAVVSQRGLDDHHLDQGCQRE